MGQPSDVDLFRAQRAKIVAAQIPRRALHAAMEAGTSEPWNFFPPSGGCQHYVRNHMDWTVAANRYRFPSLKDTSK